LTASPNVVVKLIPGMITLAPAVYLIAISEP
jgi:hypothetical protein